MPDCFFASLPNAGPCEGRLVHCHLVKEQTLMRELKWSRHKARTDPRVWVYGCGGGLGPGGHHGQFKPDGPRSIPLSLLPEVYTRFMAEHDLWWYVEVTFQPRRPFRDYHSHDEAGAAAAETARSAFEPPFAP